MSVFTPLARAELAEFLAGYDLGRLKDFQGIPGGTENSNFFVSLDGGEFVLTLVERGERADLPFCLALLERLHQAGLAVPYAVPDRQGERLRQLAGKPALLQPRLAGKHVQTANPHHCAEVGSWLARLHLATAPQPLQHPSDRGLDWMLREGPQLALPLAEPELSRLRGVLSEIDRLGARIERLPQANLHADLFRDNVLFDGPHLAGVIDFYNACSGAMLYDLAIALNDWCSLSSGQLDGARGRALLAAYARLRPFTAAEAELWPSLQRIACLRFWLSRLIAASQALQPGVLVKDPGEFSRRLAWRLHNDLPLPLAL